VKFREIEKILKEDGWYLVKVNGSHYQYKHPIKDGKVTVPYHNKELKLKTAKAILIQAGLD